MNWQAIEAIAELLGSVAVVISLLYVAAEVRASVQQARLDATRELAERISQASLTVATHRDFAEVYLRGASQFNDLDPVDQVRYRALMNTLFRGFEQQFFLRQSGALNDDAWQAVTGLIHDFALLPGVRVYLRERSSWYAPSFRQYLSEAEGVDTMVDGVPMAQQYVPAGEIDEGST